MARSLPKPSKDEMQRERFIEAARRLGCDEDPAAFGEKLKVIARHKPKDTLPEKPLPKRASKAL